MSSGTAPALPCYSTCPPPHHLSSHRSHATFLYLRTYLPQIRQHPGFWRQKGFPRNGFSLPSCGAGTSQGHEESVFLCGHTKVARTCSPPTIARQLLCRQSKARSNSLHAIVPAAQPEVSLASWLSFYLGKREEGLGKHTNQCILPRDGTRNESSLALWALCSL